MSNMSIGIATMLPWLAAIVAMTLVGMSSDRHNERHLHFAGSFVVGAIGLIGSVFMTDPMAAFFFIGVGAAGIWSALGVLWTIPPTLFTGTAIAGSLALINAIGNLGGFVGPYMMGVARDATGSFSTGIVGLAVVMLAGAAAAVLLKRTTRATADPVTA